jgi:hypothetical protein
MDELERLCKDPIMIQVSHQEDRVHVAEPVQAVGYTHTHMIVQSLTVDTTHKGCNRQEWSVH